MNTHRLDVSDFEHTQPGVTHCWPAPITTKTGYIARFWRWVRCAWLRARIWMTEDWLRDCARDGITDSLNLRAFRRDLEALRVQLAILEMS